MLGVRRCGRLVYVVEVERALAAPAAGTEPFNFLALDADARAVALGGAYTALATDANALLYNPAGLGLVRQSQIAFMHNQYIAGLTQEYMGLATPYVALASMPPAAV